MESMLCAAAPGSEQRPAVEEIGPFRDAIVDPLGGRGMGGINLVIDFGFG